MQTMLHQGLNHLASFEFFGATDSGLRDKHIIVDAVHNIVSSGARNAFHIFRFRWLGEQHGK